MPTLSPHQELTDGLRALIAAWGSLPSGFSVERGYSVEKYVGGWADAAPGRIILMVTAVDAARVGNVNVDEVTVSVAYLKKMSGQTNELLDAADLQADALRVFLTSSTCRNVTINSNAQRASRINTTLPTPYAADLIRQSEIFAAVIQTTYHLPRVV